MNRKKIIIALALLIVLVLGIIFLVHDGDEDTDQLFLYGNVDVREVDLGFQVNGRVIKLFAEEGDLIPQNMLLAVLDKKPFQDHVAESEANLAAIRMNFENAEKLLKRRQELIQDGGVSQEDLDNAFNTYSMLAANIKQAEASLEIAKTNLDYTEIYAPTEGTILTRIREPGTVVNNGDPVYTLSVTSPVWIRAYVSEPQLGLIYPGMAAEISTDTPNGKVYQGHIGFISPVAEFTPKTVETTQLRTDLVYRLRIYADNPDKNLKQGMPVTVRLPLVADDHGAPP